jgi:hypothetical protein
MGRPNYVCTVCTEHFTRKNSAKRHNLNIQHNTSEILSYIEYMVDRSAGKYLASHPSWHRKQRQLQANRSYPSDNRVIADSSFRPEILLQPYPAALPNSQTATIQQKLDELKVLAGKFCFPEDARKILEWLISG